MPQAQSLPPPLPLKGLKVIELSHLIAGPYCTMLLAAEGAEVVKVEPPQGELSRVHEPMRRTAEGEMSAFYGALNRGKKSLVLDLKNAAGIATFRDLLKSADVLMTNIRGGALDRCAVLKKQLVRLPPILAAGRGTPRWPPGGPANNPAPGRSRVRAGAHIALPSPRLRPPR